MDIQDLSMVAPEIRNRRLIGAALWIWVAGAFIAYLDQFRGILPAVLKTVGLT